MHITLPMIIIYMAIPGILFLIGKKMSENKKQNFEKFSKLASKTKVHPMIFKNYIANVIKFSPIAYYTTIAYGPFKIMTYISFIIVLFGAMVWHIKDVTGKPIDIVISNFLCSMSQMKANFFMKFTVLMSLSLITTSFIMTGIVKPIADVFIEEPKTEIIQEETEEENQETQK